ncbi:MAG: ATP-binding cassette domain-containing protein [Phycisphaerae bacterium]|nr:ATP-binding cassette domain-containing protein [Phycisphaerae bacterium]
MAIIALKEVYFGFGGPPLLEDISFQIEKSERVCLLGRNGCGKSTLLGLITGRLKPTKGEIAAQPQLRIGMLDQSVPQNTAGSVFDVVAEGLGHAGKLLASYHNLAHQLSFKFGDKENAQLLKIHNELDRTNSWNKLNVVETVISQISLDADAEFSELSAGLKRRVLLARALAAEPDLLILDEPTNHLDTEAITWIEDFLLRCGKTLLFVTHDRKFLKKLSTRILEIDRGSLFNWDCSYDEYLKRKDQLLAAEQQHWNLFDKKLAEEERWIRQSIRARRTRNEGRVKKLKMLRQERSQRRTLDGVVKIEINKAERSGELIVKTENVNFAYDPNSPTVISDLSTAIFRGDRIGIIGPNGIGKTTLLKLLLGHIPPTSGKIQLGTNVQCAYFDQLHGQLNLEKDLAENIGQGYTTVTINGRKKQVVSYLMDFMFTAQKAKSPVHNLSGGERNRLQLAKLFTQPSNVLILDEPTNDLDIETLELMEEMLIDYPGTVLVVSHDRAFLNNVVTGTLVLEGNGRVKEYAGGYDDWLVQRKEAPKEQAAAKEQKQHSPKPNQAKLSYMQNRELQKLPDMIAELEQQIAQLHEKMGDPSFYKQDSRTISRTNARLEKLQTDLAIAFIRWEELAALE